MHIYRDYLELTQKESIENVCHKENKKKFIQTNNTLVIRGKLQEELGFIEDSLACKQILAGLYIPPTEVDKYTRDFL